TDTDGSLCTVGSLQHRISLSISWLSNFLKPEEHESNKKYFLTQSSVPLQAVEDSYVPVVKFEFDGAEIDLVFARPSVQTVSDNLGLGGDWHLRSLDMRCIQSLNGEMHITQLHVSALGHGIYSNLLGFLGGVSWTTLVARTCPLYSSALASAPVNKFFFFQNGKSYCLF
uniref:polynucleotide adenylyltransferase n=1 Tax=Otus sunia TaxID=257818 RepID=A0A8C8BU70_9STRI